MTVRGRWAVALSALAVVAALALLFWPRPAVPVDVAGRAGPHQVRLLIETPAVGAHDLTLDVTGPVERLVVAPTMVEMGHASAPVTATPAAPGRFRATGVEFFMPGRWDVTVTVHGSGGTDEVVLPVLIAPRGRQS
jgi:predicted acyltransferase